MMGFDAEVWIVNGIPGVGKSTVSRVLAGRYARGVHIEGDRLQEYIVSGAVGPGEMPAEEEARQIHLNVRNQCLLARSFAQAGFLPVIDYVVIDRARLAEYCAQLEGLRVRCVTLAPGIEVALARDQARAEKTVTAVWTHLDALMRAELSGIGIWVDSAHLTAEETVDYILHHAEQSLITPPMLED